MKKAKLFISAAIVFAVVGSALAFKPLGQGKIYCTKTIIGECKDQIDWQIGSNPCIIDPCLNGAGKEYFKDASNNNICTEIITGCFFTMPE